MILLSLNTDQITAQHIHAISVQITNQYVSRQPCTSLHLSLEFPTELMVYSGREEIEIARLAPGETYTAEFRVKANRPGDYMVSVRRFSYLDPRSSIQRIEMQMLTLRVVPDTALPEPSQKPLEVLLSGELKLHKWCKLNVQLRNRMKKDLEDVSIQLGGQIQAKPYYLGRLVRGAEISFVLSVKPLESGEYTPVDVTVFSKSESKQFVLESHVRVIDPKVEEDESNVNQPRNIIVQNSTGVIIGNQNQMNQEINANGKDTHEPGLRKNDPPKT